MQHQLYMTRTVMEEVPFILQSKIWEMALRREQANGEDYFHIFKVNIQKERTTIIHTQEVPSFKCTAEINTPDSIDDTLKIYVIRDGTLEEENYIPCFLAMNTRRDEHGKPNENNNTFRSHI